MLTTLAVGSRSGFRWVPVAACYGALRSAAAVPEQVKRSSVSSHPWTSGVSVTQWVIQI